MSEKKLTVGAVGVGPVGSILAVCLAEAGVRIVVADLPFRNEQISENGLCLTWGDRRIVHKVDTVDKTAQLAEYKPDCIMVATKACILGRIMPEVAKVAGNTCHVISVQNGIGTEDEIARYVPRENICRFVVNYAGQNDENGNTTMNWFNPPNFIGPLTDKTEPRLASMVNMLNSVGLTTELVDTREIRKKAFLKTILNAALMPMCAVMGMTMKEAMDCGTTRQLAGEVLDECFEVASRLGFNYGDDIREKCMGYLDKGGHHHPSMSIDLKNKRPTEIDFINGAILKEARAFDDLRPEVNRILVSMLVAQEIKNGTRKPDEIPEYIRL